MEQICITDNFMLFVNNYGVDEQSIQDTFNAADSVQKISRTRTLFYKHFPDRITQHLLICVKEVNSENRLSFAFWLPEHTLCNNLPLDATLAMFCNTFGSTIYLDDVIAKYIESAELCGILDDDIDKLITTDTWEETPVFRHYIATAKWNCITLTHIFAINQYQYQRWYKNSDVETVDINGEWSDFLNNIIENLDPIRKTKLEITTTKKNPLWGTNPTTQTKPKNDTTITFPKLYKSELNAIIGSLQKGGNVSVSPKLNTGCLFCGNKSKSQEHILPTWFRNYFPEYSFDSMTHVLDTENLNHSYEYGLSRGKESSYGITTYDVCISCNNEWMSELENDVKRIITRDSSNLKESHEFSLTSDNRHLLSRWLICKALLLAIRAQLLPPFTQKIIRNLREGRIAEGFLVEVHAVQCFGLNYQISVQTPPVRINKNKKGYISDLSANLFVAAIHVGHVFYRVSHWSHENEYPRTSVWPDTFTIYPFYSHLPANNAVSLELDNIDLNSHLRLFLRSLEVSEGG